MSEDLYVAGIASSAGGLEALTKLLNSLPMEDVPLGIVVAQHLSPTHKSHMVQLLSKNSSWEVLEAKHKLSIENNKVYITPPDRDIVVKDGLMLLSKPPAEIGPKPNANLLFKSIAKEYGPKSIGVVLSGTGRDGSEGVASINGVGGSVFSQEPQTAAYDGMPVSAIETQQVNFILSAEEIGTSLGQWVTGKLKLDGAGGPTNEEQQIVTDLNKIFELLEKKTGVDFSNYKMSTIQRRLESRIAHLHISSLSDYLKYIEESPGEVSELFNHVLIGVTHFFRDPIAFKALLPLLQEHIRNKNEQSLRIWVPGCATGEEAYTISILISEILGDDLPQWNIQIFATDIDDDAIAIGRKGQYPKAALELMDQDWVKKYFTQTSDGIMEVQKKLRSLILFSRHDLTNNPPFLKLDLISCRNLLIYFNIDLQKRVIPVFQYALDNDALLFLGKSENLGVHTDLFSPKDKKHKIWTRKAGAKASAPRFRPLKPSHPNRNRSSRVSFEIKTIPERVENTLFLNFNHPYVVVNESLEIMYVAGDVSPFLQFNQGSMTTNLLKQSNSEIELVLHTTIQSTIKSLEPHQSQPRRLKGQDENLLFRIVCQPMLHFKDTQFLVIFESFNVDQNLLAVEDQSNQDFESIRIAELQQELDSTREHLQSYIEELETANEEMQALNEELQSTNEELQSVNEELETSNEEMQSTNEEMHIAYQELRDLHDVLKRKESEQEHQNKELTSLLNNDLQGFILVNEDFEIKQFNVYAAKVFNSLVEKKLKLGGSLLKYLPKDWVGQIVNDSRKAQTTENGVRLSLNHNSGNGSAIFDLSIKAVANSTDLSIGMMDVSLASQMQERLKSLNELMDEAGAAVNLGGWVLDLKSGKTTWTKQVYAIHEVKDDFLTNLNQGLQFYPPDAQAKLNEKLEEVISEGKSFDLDLPFKTAKGRELMVRVTGNPHIKNNQVIKAWGIIQDISEEYRFKRDQEALTQELLKSNKELEEFAYVASHDLQEPLRMVHSFIQLLEESLEGQLESKQIKYLHFITDGAQRMQNMLIDLLEYSRVNSNKDSEELISLRKPLEAAIINQQDLIKSTDAEISIEEMPEVLAVPSQMERLFSNLINNALKYNTRKPELRISYVKTRLYHQISIRDNGIGIDAKYLDRIFGVFQRLHSQDTYPGNGVGLAVCKRIINKHRGKIEVESVLGSGTTFFIYLPLD